MRFSALIRGFLFFILCSLVFVAPAFAQSQTPIQSGQTYQNYQTNSYATPNNDPDVPNNLHTYSQNIVIEMLSAVACQLGGVDPSGPGQKCLGYDQKTNKIGFVENGGGALGVMDHLIAMTFTPPIHTSDYLSYLSHNFGLAKPAYAAPATGLGFSSLTPLVPMWTASRNIVYLVFVFAFILIGLGIMFRIKIDPRTVMSIQNQIPRIIVALLLVTFSLAIAGFLIDIMYVSIYLVYGLFQGAVQTAAPQALQGISPITLQGQSLPGVYAHMGSPTVFSMANNVALSFKDNVQSFLGVDGCPNVQECVKNVFNPLKVGWDIFGKGNDHSVANYIIDFISYGTGFGTFLRIMTVPNAVNEATPGISSLVSALQSGPKVALAISSGTAVFSATEFLLRIGLPWLIAWLVITIATLWAMFRVWFTLIGSFIFILLDITIAPFWFVAGIFPGSKVGFGIWFRDIVANLAAFPVTIVMFLTGRIFMELFAKNPGGFVPPLIGNPNDTKSFASLLGIGFILMTPAALRITRDALKAPKFDTTPIRQAIGAGFGGPGRLISGGSTAAFGVHLPEAGGKQPTLAKKIFRGMTGIR